MDRHSNPPTEINQSWLPDKSVDDVRLDDHLVDPTPFKDRPMRQVVVPGPNGQRVVVESNLPVEELKAFKVTVEEGVAKIQTGGRRRRRVKGSQDQKLIEDASK